MRFACIDDTLVIQYFEKSFMQNSILLSRIFQPDEEVRRYLHGNERSKRPDSSSKCFVIRKMKVVSPALTKIIRESAKENKCNTENLYKDTLKTNFITLMEMELYLRADYGVSRKKTKVSKLSNLQLNFCRIPSISLFGHEYCW
jgi:hypothetical protein